MSTILSWLLSFILDYLLKRAGAAVAVKYAQVKEDERREKIDHANIEAFEQAKDRHERIERAVGLLNGDAP